MAEQAELEVTTEQTETTATVAATTTATEATEATQTPEQIEAAKVETARVAALTPAQKAAEAKAAKKAGETTTETPADYTALKLPEGYKADDPVFADALKLFEGEKISPQQAQKLIDFTAKRDQEMAKAGSAASAEAWKKQGGEWEAASKKEFSAEDLGLAKGAFSKVFDKETAAYLESLHFANHPGVVRGMVKVAKAIKDDTFVSGNAAVANGSDARKSFPNSNMNP